MSNSELVVPGQVLPGGPIKELLQGVFLNRLLEMAAECIRDKDKMQTLATSVLEMAETFTAGTTVEWDDQIVDTLKYFAENEDAWDFIHEHIVSLYDVIFTTDELVEADERYFTAFSNGVVLDAEKVELNAVMVSIIISAAVELFKWWRDCSTDEETEETTIDEGQDSGPDK